MKLKNINRVKDLINWRDELFKNLEYLGHEGLRINGRQCCEKFEDSIRAVLQEKIKDLIKTVENELEIM